MLRLLSISKIGKDKLNICKKINLNLKKFQKRVTCSFCNNKGYIKCSCNNGCNICNHSGFYLCHSCNGVGQFSYTYF